MSAGVGQATAASPTYALSYIFDAVDHSPTSAKEGTTITSVPFNTSGSVQVQLSSPNGGGVSNKDISIGIASGPSSASLDGTKIATTDSNGVASFSNLSIAQPGHYILQAFNTKLGASTPSATFTIWQNACNFDQSGGCPASDPTTGLLVGYSASSNATVGKLIVNTGVDQLTIPNDGFCHAPAVTTAEATSDFNGTSRTIVLTFPKSKCGGGAFQVLLGKDRTFVVFGGTYAAFNATDQLYEGNAPPCNATYQINGAQYKITPGVDPCLQSSVSRKAPKSVQIETLIVPGADIRCI